MQNLQPIDLIVVCRPHSHSRIVDSTQLNEPYNPHELFGTSDEVPYRLVQALIESSDHGSHAMAISRSMIVKVPMLDKSLRSVPSGILF